MRRSELFWGVMLVILGSLFFLRTAGYLTGDIFGWFWPLLIIAAGAWMLFGGFKGEQGASNGRSFAVPLQGADQALLTVNHGVGRLELGSGASPADIVTGNLAAGLTHSSHLVGTRLEVEIDAGPSLIPFIGPASGAWSLKLNPAVPTQILIHAGASRVELDLSDLHITQLDYDGGASSLKISLPGQVDRFSSHIRAGASSIDVRVPSGISARIVILGPASTTIDPARFAPAGQGVYQSPDYGMALRRAEVTIEGGATSVRVE